MTCRVRLRLFTTFNESPGLFNSLVTCVNRPRKRSSRFLSMSCPLAYGPATATKPMRTIGHISKRLLWYAWKRLPERIVLPGLRRLFVVRVIGRVLVSRPLLVLLRPLLLRCLLGRALRCFLVSHMSSLSY